MTSSYYRGAQGVILGKDSVFYLTSLPLVYDVSNRSTFTHLETWFEELATYATEGVVKIIVGNKNDKHGREVSRKEGEGLAEKV